MTKRTDFEAGKVSEDFFFLRALRVGKIVSEKIGE